MTGWYRRGSRLSGEGRLGGWRDAGFAAALTLVAVAGLHTVYSGMFWLVQAGAGIALALGAGLFAHRRRWSVLPSALGSTVLWAVAAGPVLLQDTTVAGFAPTGTTLRVLLDGVLDGWWDLLTVNLPQPASGHFAVVPYACGFAGALAAFLGATRSRLVAAGLPGPLVALVGTILLGTDRPAVLWVQGAAFVVIALGWVALRQAATALGPVRPFDPVRSAHPAGPVGPVDPVGLVPPVGLVRPTRSGLAGAVAMLLLAGAVGLGVGQVHRLLDEHRFVLREQIAPPFNPRQLQSPLAELRRYTVLHKSEPLFTVTGLAGGGRIRFAALDAYDGEVWQVADWRGEAGSGTFERVGQRLSTGPGQRQRVELTLAQLTGNWLPLVGQPRRIDFADDHALAEDFRYNRVTGTGLMLRRPTAGQRYRIETVLPTTPPAEQLTGQPVQPVALPQPRQVPQVVSARAQLWTRETRDPLTQIRVLVDKLRAGAYSDGVDDDPRARPGHGAGRLREFLSAEPLVGDAEQYAAALALMIRSLGLPSRVVVGVNLPAGQTGPVTGGMVTAWVEVPVAGQGWVPFDPTPPVTNSPKPPQPEQQPDGSAARILPPAAVTTPPPQLPPPDTVTDPRSSRPSTPDWWPVISLVLRIAVPILGLAALVVAILLGKARRRRLRQEQGSPGGRLAGGFTELLDQLRDLGITTPAGTRRQQARAIERSVGGAPAPWSPTTWESPTAEPTADKVTAGEVTAGEATARRAVTAAELTAEEAVTVGEAAIGEPATRELAAGQLTARGLAAVADRAVYGPGEPTEAAVHEFWAQVDGYLRQVSRTRSRLRRVTAALNPVSLPRPRLPHLRLPRRLVSLRLVSRRLLSRSSHDHGAPRRP